MNLVETVEVLEVLIVESLRESRFHYILGGKID
jgi:hypothetical protein